MYLQYADDAVLYICLTAYTEQRAVFNIVQPQLIQPKPVLKADTLINII